MLWLVKVRVTPNRGRREGNLLWLGQYLRTYTIKGAKIAGDNMEAAFISIYKVSHKFYHFTNLLNSMLTNKQMVVKTIPYLKLCIVIG